jgi:hypothetical protein
LFSHGDSTRRIVADHDESLLRELLAERDHPNPWRTWR